MNDPNDLIVIYEDEDGKQYKQPLLDISNVGTLIDPDTDEDLEIVGWEVRKTHATSN